MSDFDSRLRASLVSVPDFPAPGILFYDLTPVFADANFFREMIEELARPWLTARVQAVLAPESRGFIVGVALAQRLGAAFLPARKKGKLPRATLKSRFSMEYRSEGEDIFVHADACGPGTRVLFVDDVLATGGTAGACCDLVKQLDAELLGASFVLEINSLNGRTQLPAAAKTEVLLSIS